ncbi:uncharacterized protein AAG666_014800 [Megaptera novaeangliae]
MEYILFVLYFSSFLCLCALVCLYFSGCQEMTYKHEGEVGGSHVCPMEEVAGAQKGQVADLQKVISS